MTPIPAHTQFSLNVRGLLTEVTRKPKMKLIQNIIKEYKPDIIYIQEHHFRSNKDIFDAFKGILSRGGRLVGVSLAKPDDPYAGVAALIPETSVLLELVEDHSISNCGRWAAITIKTDSDLLSIINVYAPAKSKVIRESFFENLATQSCMANPNLIAVGDWNFVSDSIDKLNLNGMIEPEPQPIAEKMFDDSELIDILRYYDDESIITTYKAAGKPYWARLDRWYSHYDLLGDLAVLPNISVPAISDHDIIRVQYGNPYKTDIPTNPIYRMSGALIKQLAVHDSEIRRNVETVLSQTNTIMKSDLDPDEILIVYDNMKDDLKTYFKQIDDKYKNLKRIKMAQAIKLSSFDIGPMAPPLAEQLLEKEKALDYIKNTQRKDIEDMTLRSGFHWLRDAELSNKLFFKATRQKVAQSQIPDVKVGNVISRDHEQKKLLIGASFAQTFTKRTPEREALNSVKNAILRTQRPGLRQFKQPNQERIRFLLDIKSRNKDEHANPSEDWLIKTIESIKMYKAPGADGIPNEFYYILRNNSDLIEILKRIFETSLDLGKLPKSMSTTYYKLLYKKESFTAHQIVTGALNDSPNDPRLLSNWRPIALIPCDSKLLSAYTAQSIKHYMGDIISPQQSAFVPGRSIMDNVMLMQMLIHHHMSRSKKAGLLFLDFAHAYDFISQEYIFEVLEAMQFPLELLKIIKISMMNQVGRVIVNSDLTHTFKVDNGGKQGDPLFPLIYIAAMEGLFALMDVNPDFQGIQAPGQRIQHFKYQGYADDTAIGISDESEIPAIELSLKTYELASGNEIKPAKSFILWLGSAADAQSQMTIFGIKPLQPGQTERYLGVQIGHDILKIPQWDTIIRNINNIFKNWNRLGLAIFGRTLLINSSQMSKLWFVGSLATASTKEEIAMANAIDSYFRKGKRNNTISHATRILPKEFGGLGQLEISTQLKLLKVKWIIRAHSGSDSLWTAYWHECENQIKTHFNLVSDLRLASLNWLKVKATAKNKLFPFVVDAFKAWHHFKLYTNTNDFYEVSCQPILDNKYVVCPISGKSFQSYPDFKKLTDGVRSLTVGLFFKDNDNPPNREYNYNDPGSWACIPRETWEMNDITNTDASQEVWNAIFNLIPSMMVETMTKGPGIFSGWAAIYPPPLGDSPFGCVYYVIPPTKRHSIRLARFELEDKDLIFKEFDCPEWGQWHLEILPHLRPLGVTSVTGTPRILGWRNSNITNESFYIPIGDQNGFKSLEAIIASPFYFPLLKIQPPPTLLFKPLWGGMNKAVRRVGARPLSALEIWLPSREETTTHTNKIARGDISPNSVLKINWKLRFQKMTSCCFVLPKYRQLIYWITTNTLFTGKILHHVSSKGFCPHCGAIAYWIHMFFECPNSDRVWKCIDDLGKSHWSDYVSLMPNEIPVLLNTYHPMTLLHLSTLWALWVQWCSYFHDTEFIYSNSENWIAQIITKVRDEFRARLHESCSVIQWLKLLADRKEISDDPDSGAFGKARISEKEFLLTHSNAVLTNCDHINLNGTSPPQGMIQWIGRGTLISLEGDELRPKLKFNMNLWDIHTRPPDVYIPRDYQPDDWVIRPRFCVGDF